MSAHTPAAAAAQSGGCRRAEPAYEIQKRERAVTVTVSAAGWVRPKDHVDVISTFKDPQTNALIGVTILQNVIVLATEKTEPPKVSLLVIPEEGEMLAVAQGLGALTLSLRNPDDIDVLEEPGRATVNTLMSGERRRVLQQKRLDVIQVIRGAGGGWRPCRR